MKKLLAFLLALLTACMPLFIMLIGFWIFMMRQMQGGGGGAKGAMSFGKSRAKLQGEDLYYVVTDHIGTPRELIFGWHGYRVVSDRWVPRSRQLDCVKFHGSRSSRRL